MRHLFIISFLFTTHCMSGQKSPEQLIVPWSEELTHGEAPLPFVAKYARDGNGLIYFAARHSNNTSEPTFQMLQTALKQYPAEVLLLEGFESERGYSPQEIKEWAIDDGINGHFSGGEVAYAVQLALKKKIPFRGLEPSEKDIFEKLQNQKISAQDLLNYYFVRQVPQWKRGGTLNLAKLESAYSQFVKSIAEKIAATVISCDYKEFLNWYKLKNKEDFIVSTFDSEKAAPYAKGKYYTQRLASQIGRIRDLHMVTLIQDELKTKTKVFVVVGGSHWMTQKMALESIYGFPSFDFKKN
jgi:hypothetical protein